MLNNKSKMKSKLFTRLNLDKDPKYLLLRHQTKEDKTCYTSLDILLKDVSTYKANQSQRTFLNSPEPTTERDLKTRTISSMNNSTLYSKRLKTEEKQSTVKLKQFKKRKLQVTVAKNLPPLKIQKELSKIQKGPSHHKTKQIVRQCSTLTEEPKNLISTIHQKKNLQTLLKKTIVNFGSKSKSERFYILKNAYQKINSDLSQNIRLSNKFSNIAEDVPYYETNQKDEKIINEQMFQKISLKDEVAFQVQINSIQMKNAERQKFKERILRIMLSAAAHLTRLGISLSDFFETNNENIPKNLTNDFKLLIFAIKDNDFDRVKSLVESNKFLIQMFDDFKQTPLHIAAKRNRSEMIKFFLIAGAKIDLEDITGKTALHIACMYNVVENVKVLLYEYASPFKMDHEGKYPADYAVDTVIKFFIDRMKTLVNFNLKLNIQESLKRIRNGLRFFFELPTQDLKLFI